MSKKIVVAGAGYAGILAAKKLAKRIKKQKLDAEVTIIDRNPFHTMLTELHEVAAWRVEEESIRISLKRVFAGRKVNVVCDNITKIDYAEKSVKAERGEYTYDYLVLASGSKPVFFGIEGAEENTFTLWSYDDAVKLREHIYASFLKASRESDDAKRREILTFAVAGCGFTGVEMMGELAEFVPVICRNFEIDPKDVTLLNLDMLPRVCTVLPEKQSAKVQRRLEKMGVTVMLNTGITGVGKDFLRYKQGETVTEVKCGTVIWTAGIEGSEIAKESGETLGGVGRGRIQTDEFLRSQNDKSVYVAGDNIFYIPNKEKTAVPQMVENCEQCADTIAHNLIVDLGGKGEHEAYKPSFHGVMVCVGGRWGTAHVGLPGKFFGLPSFLAMFSKHFINIIYFIQVLGWNKIFSYISHEFFTIRNCRSFVGGHFSNRSPSFMLVPLRMFLGAWWLYEGIVKITEGWLTKLQLAGFLGIASDAESAASAATESMKELWHLNILNLMRFSFTQGDDYGFKIQVGFVDLILNNVVVAYDPVAWTFQVGVVLLEILIGLALLGGLFTTPAAVVSLVLQFMFLSSTGLWMSAWWMLFASIAMIFGGGRALSLDYYAMPWLKKHWNGTRLAKKSYLYHD